MQSSQKEKKDSPNNVISKILKDLLVEAKDPAFDHKKSRVQLHSDATSLSIVYPVFLASSLINASTQEQLNLLFQIIDEIPQIKNWAYTSINVGVRYNQTSEYQKALKEEKAKLAKSRGIELNYNLLHYAVLNPHVINNKSASIQLIEKLVSRGYELNNRLNYLCITPLETCAQFRTQRSNDDNTVVDTLLRMVELGAKIPDGLQLIDILYIYGNTAYVKKLQEKGQTLNTQAVYMACAEKGYLDKLKQLDKEAKTAIDVNFFGKHNRTPLMAAIKKYEQGVVEYLVKEKKADLSLSVRHETRSVFTNALDCALEAGGDLSGLLFLINNSNVNDLYIKTDIGTLNIFFYLEMAIVQKDDLFDTILITALKRLQSTELSESEKIKAKKMLQETYDGFNIMHFLLTIQRYKVVDALLDIPDFDLHQKTMHEEEDNLSSFELLLIHAISYGLDISILKKALQRKDFKMSDHFSHVLFQTAPRDNTYEVIQVFLDLKLLAYSQVFDGLIWQFDDPIPAEYLNKYWKGLKLQYKDDEEEFREDLYDMLLWTINRKNSGSPDPMPKLAGFILSKIKGNLDYFSQSQYETLANAAKANKLEGVYITLSLYAERINKKQATLPTESKLIDYATPSQSIQAKSGLAVVKENLGSVKAQELARNHRKKKDNVVSAPVSSISSSTTILSSIQETKETSKKKNKKNRNKNSLTSSSSSSTTTSSSIQEVKKSSSLPLPKTEVKSTTTKETQSASSSESKTSPEKKSENPLFDRVVSIYKHGNEHLIDKPTYAYILQCQENTELDNFLTDKTSIHNIEKFDQCEGFHITLLDVGHNANMESIFSNPKMAANARSKIDELIKESKIDTLLLTPFRLSAFGKNKNLLVIELKDTAGELVKLNADLMKLFREEFNIVIPIDKPFKFIPHITVGQSDNLSREMIESMNSELQKQNPCFSLSIKNCALSRKMGWKLFAESDILHAMDFEKETIRERKPKRGNRLFDSQMKLIASSNVTISSSMSVKPRS